jgi:hypothetical protein
MEGWPKREFEIPVHAFPFSAKYTLQPLGAIKVTRPIQYPFAIPFSVKNSSRQFAQRMTANDNQVIRGMSQRTIRNHVKGKANKHEAGNGVANL